MLNTPPIYMTIVEDLRRQLANGRLKPQMLLCTEKSLCEKYGVSRITAKHAIEILEKEGLVYRKRGSGSFVAGGGGRKNGAGPPYPLVPQNAALVLPFSIAKGGWFRAIETATSILAGSNYYFSLHVAENEEETLSLIENIDVSALVYYPVTGIKTNALDAFARKGVPVIIVDKPHECPQYSNIVCDHHYGQFLLTEHLLTYGHRKTVYISRYADDRASLRERFMGYVDAVRQSGLGIMPVFFKLDPGAIENCSLMRHVVMKLYKEGYTALLCENDIVAFHAVMACRGLGIRVPAEMSVVGFDNIDWSIMGGVDITTIDQGFDRIGMEMAKLITGEGYAPVKIRVPVQLVPRSSTGAAPNASPAM